MSTRRWIAIILFMVFIGACWRVFEGGPEPKSTPPPKNTLDSIMGYHIIIDSIRWGKGGYIFYAH
jgi:hypothetical protein